MPVATNLPEYMVNECKSGPPVGMALVTGTADPQVSFNGGTITVLGQQRDVVLSSEQTIALWLCRNGCGSNTQTQTIDVRPDDDVSVALRNWSCSGAPVGHYAVQGGGHTWPSGRQFLLSGLLVLYHVMLTRHMRGGPFSRSSNAQLPKRGSTPLTLALNAI
ncbi:hypothetical protein N9Q54_03065 [Octadecabacter sp.]|nr:hypothetical protein [Octadecabacter sp.]